MENEKTTLLNRLLTESPGGISTPKEDAKSRYVHIELFPGTPADKARLTAVLQSEYHGEKLATGLWRIAALPPFVPLPTAVNPNATLSEDDVTAIRQALRDRTATQLQLATQYGVSQSLISRIKRWEIWGHVASDLVPRRQHVTYDETVTIWKALYEDLTPPEELADTFNTTLDEINRIARLPKPETEES